MTDPTPADPSGVPDPIQRSAKNAAAIARAERDRPDATPESILEAFGLLIGFVAGIARP